MSFLRYESYKDSGIVWFGEVPKHWRVEKFKRVLRERDERSQAPLRVAQVILLHLRRVIPRIRDGVFACSVAMREIMKPDTTHPAADRPSQSHHSRPQSRTCDSAQPNRGASRGSRGSACHAQSPASSGRIPSLAASGGSLLANVQLAA
jgi:hypothetical protein